MGTARPLGKLEDRDIRVQKLEAALRKERRLRVEAENQTRRFHALLIAERVRNIKSSTAMTPTDHGGARYAPDGREGAYNSDQWWPAGLPEWIGQQVAAGDELFVALDKGLRSFGWPAYNVPQPLPRENTWPALALMLAQHIRESRDE